MFWQIFRNVFSFLVAAMLAPVLGASLVMIAAQFLVPSELSGYFATICVVFMIFGMVLYHLHQLINESYLSSFSKKKNEEI